MNYTTEISKLTLTLKCFTLTKNKRVAHTHTKKKPIWWPINSEHASPPQKHLGKKTKPGMCGQHVPDTAFHYPWISGSQEQPSHRASSSSGSSPLPPPSAQHCKLHCSPQDALLSHQETSPSKTPTRKTRRQKHSFY